MRYFLKLSYDGTNFHGWQRQPMDSSVQETIEKALSTILRKDTPIVGAGRTDTGVHAAQMYAHFDAVDIPEETRFIRSLNNMVGHDISIEAILPVTDDAHARFDAVSRTYRYVVTLKKDPFLFRYAHRLYKLPDVELMNHAAGMLLNVNDFTSFAKLHTDTKTNICDVRNAEWQYLPSEDKLIFTISADRFLRNMVRAVVGTLLDVGSGKLSINEFVEIIERKNRCEAGASMPAKGLFLTEVVYPERIFL